ncbi:MAG: AgmX/PglI C-terminal domain-containing protein, partial [Deltaproteobacteria bacterium]|nr:AgmX/PglI C-terminal domain-containing protein [Deltaproteobacteria bacterium]
DSLKAEASVRKPNLRLKKILVSGGITTKSVRKIVERDVLGANNCLQITVGQVPGHKGEIGFRLIISPDGKVKEVRVTKGKVKDKTFLRCLTRTLQSLQLPATADHREAAVTLIFELAWL